MATILFMVKATIPSDKAAAFNHWYNEEHVPQALQFAGLVSANRYKLIDGDDKYQHMTVYEAQSARWAQESMGSAGVDAAAGARVHALVMATKHQGAPTAHPGLPSAWRRGPGRISPARSGI